jgi:hypothetical protein
MSLGSYVAERRLRILEDLQAGREPSEGAFDVQVLKEAKVKSKPQMGSTRFVPDAIHLEFIYPDPMTTATVFTVTLSAPERIVFLPVPEWVVESIWQGEISGGFHFESDAMRMVDGFVALLAPDANAPLFAPAAAKRRE